MKHMVKRSLEVTICVTGLVVYAPVLALIAVAIKLESPGPVLYLQERQKTDGGTFPMCRFRCLAGVGTEQIHLTVVGRFLRRYRLDELPMLLNVVRGHVSLSEAMRFGDVLHSLLPSWLTAIPGPPQRYERAVWIVLLSLLVVLFVLAVILTR